MIKYLNGDRKKIFIDNIVGGVGWGIGATIGASILLAILGYILSQLNFVPFIGEYIIEINKFISSQSS